MEEAQNICDTISIIDHGKILAEGTVNELVKLVTEYELLFVKIKDINLSHQESILFKEINRILWEMSRFCKSSSE